MRHFLKNSVLGIGLALALGSLAALAQAYGPITVQTGSPASPVINSNATNGIYFGTNNTGFTRHWAAGSTATANLPVLSACGTTPALTTGSTDTAGTVTMGTSATGCVITFGTAHAAAPSCVVSWRATPLASQSYTTATTALTLTQTSTSNNLVDYWCTSRGS